MPDIQVVKRLAVSYTANGESATSDESYIKILTSFRNGTLRKLQGAPLSAFVSVALHEADDPPGVTMREIEEETGVSYRHLLRVMPWLCSERYCVIASEDPEGNQIYRVAAFAWFGNNSHRSNPPQRGSNTLPIEAKPQPSAPTGRGSNTSEVQPAPASNRRSRNKGSYDILSHANGVPHDDDVLTKLSTDSLNKHHDMAAVEKILERAFEGVNVKRLAKILKTVERATEWVDWIEDSATQKKFRNPAGIAYTTLMKEPEAHPLGYVKRAIEQNKPRRPVVSGRYALEHPEMLNPEQSE